jgi:hypothetical protein
MTADDTSGFPPGYFVIRSVACARLLDVTMDEIEDGTEIALWPEKEKSLVESTSFTLLPAIPGFEGALISSRLGFRDPETNNQVRLIYMQAT